VDKTMDIRRTLRGATCEVVLQFLKPHATLAVLAALAAVPIALLIPFAPRPLVLPILSVAAIAIAGVTALVAWAFSARRGGDTITAWDVAGAFALIGCGAAMLSEPENVLNLLGSAVVP
jgi:hypothetical protein